MLGVWILMSREGDQMHLYTNTGTRESIKKCNAMNIGLLLSEKWYNPDKWPYFALDNGCFAAYHRQEEWSPVTFLKFLERCKKEKRVPDFIVIPDMPLSKFSLEFSIDWIPILERLYPEFPKYLAVQDGMSTDDVDKLIGHIDGIFVGGSMDWKMNTMKTWVDYAHRNGMKCHVGRIGPIQRMMICELAGADSIDSTTWVQNKGGIDHYVGGFKAQTRIEDHGEAIE